jgi:hypothetical protein
MPGKNSGGGLGHTIGRVLLALVLIGFLIAVLRVFDWDPFGVIDWAWNLVTTVVTRISDFFSGNRTFQEVFTAPGLLFFR